jgi:uncharacterized protein (DUF362 family)
MPERVKVSLVRTEDRERGVRAAVGLLGEVAWPFDGAHVVLKPNFNSDDPFPGSTHNDTLRALVALLRELGGSGITIADRSGASWVTEAVLAGKGIPELAEELSVELVATDQQPPETWERVGVPNGHWQRGVEVPKLFLEAEAIVQTCCLKTHRFGGHFTMSLKNAVGVIAKDSVFDGYGYMGEMHGSPHIREMIAEINQLFAPALVVMDAIDAFVQGGPATGTSVHPGLILASTDRVALDAAGVAILRTYETTPEVAEGRIFDLDQIRRAADLGIGVESADRIELVAADDPGSREAARVIREVLAEG